MTYVGFLTFLIALSSVGALMRRTLTIRTTYAPTRSSNEQLAFAYDVLVSSEQREIALAERTEETAGHEKHSRVAASGKRASR